MTTYTPDGVPFQTGGRTGLWLVGADGSTWNLRSGPVVLSEKGAEGFGPLKWNRPVNALVTRDGQRKLNLRSRALPREGFLPVTLMGSRVNGGYPALSEAWFSAWSVDVPAQLVVIRPDGSRRQLDVYYVTDDYVSTIDPATSADVPVGVSWIADQPFWEGDEVRQVVTGTEDLTLVNDGDVAVPPVYTIRAYNDDVTSFHIWFQQLNQQRVHPEWWQPVRVSSTDITIHGAGTGTGTEGSEGVLTLTTEDASAMLQSNPYADPFNVTHRLDEYAFAEIPAKSSIDGAVGSDGGQMTISYRPRYLRAF